MATVPLNPNFLERLVLLRLNKGPAPMPDLFGAASFESVTLALEMGVFETLAEGYPATDDDRYHLASMTEKWLLADSGTNMGPWLTAWNDLVFPFWERELETAVREGEPSRSIYEWFDEEPGRWKVAQAGSRATASLFLDDVVAAITVPADAERVIDVGGATGCT